MNRKRLALLMVDGFGLSLSWQGNAIIPSSLPEFERLWRSYRHMPLLPFPRGYNTAEREMSPWSMYTLIGLLKNQYSNHQFVDAVIADKSFHNLPPLTSLASYIKQHSSSLHLLGNLSKDGEIGDQAHLEAIVRASKVLAVEHVYIHIIVDKSFTSGQDASDFIQKVEQRLLSIRPVEIKTIVGEECFADERLWDKLGHDMFLYPANRALSVGQALSKLDQEPGLLYPTAIGSENKKLFSEFDGVLLFNHNPDRIGKFVSRRLRGPRSILPRFTKLCLLSPLAGEDDSDDTICRRPETDYLVNELADGGVKVSGLAFKDDLAVFQSYFLGSARRYPLDEIACNYANLTEDEIHKAVKEYFESLVNKIASPSPDLVIAHFGLLGQICFKGDFALCQLAAKELGACLPALEKAAIDHGVRLVLTAPFGMAERMLARSDKKLDNYQCLPSENNIPFVVVSEPSRVRGPLKESSIGLVDIIRAKRDITSISSYIFNAFK